MAIKFHKLSKNLSLIGFGFTCGIATFFIFQKFHSAAHGPFSIDYYYSNNIVYSNDEVVVSLRGHPIVRLKDQVTYYKFFISGETVPSNRAIICGSIDPDRIGSFNWLSSSETEMKEWAWDSEDQLVSSQGREKGLHFGDVFVTPRSVPNNRH